RKSTPEPRMAMPATGPNQIGTPPDFGSATGAAAADFGAAAGAGSATVKTNEPLSGSPSSEETVAHLTVYLPKPSPGLSDTRIVVRFGSVRSTLPSPWSARAPLGPTMVREAVAGTIPSAKVATSTGGTLATFEL